MITFHFGMQDSITIRACKKTDGFYTKHNGLIIKRNDNEFQKFVNQHRRFYKNISVVYVNSFEML